MPPTLPPAASTDPDDDDLPTLIPGSGSEKLQRWVDLLAALLARNTGATFEELAPSIPAYALKQERLNGLDDTARDRQSASLKRSFERDKDDLRRLGVAIESLKDERGLVTGSYRLKRENFYLPYLVVAVAGEAMTTPNKVDAYGYQTLTSLMLEPDELAAIVDAAVSVRSLGDPLLRIDVDAALRKLAIDLPIGDVASSADVPHLISVRVQPDGAVFAALGEALRNAKRVTFTYHSMTTDQRDQREVEPYGLFFVSAHWYVVGRDVTRDEIRNFRLSRIQKLTVSKSAQQTPDFTVPSSFRLREHAKSRQSWELGDDPPIDVVVEFTGASGPTLAASELGAEVPEQTSRRRFTVRRPDAFVRWVLSLAGEARIITPTSLVSRTRELAMETRALYAADVVSPLPPSQRLAARAAASTTPWEPRGAASQLRRLLLVVPTIADGEDHSLAEVATRIGCDVSTLQQDLYSLVQRFETPAGFVEGVQLYLDSDQVSAYSNHLRRPMRLTVNELCALELGLAVLRSQRPPDEHAVLDRARKRLQQVISRLPDDPIPSSLRHASSGDFGTVTHLAAVRTGLRERRKLQISYRKSGSTITSERIVCPYALVSANGMLYLIAHCEQSAALRVFRLDRVQQVSVSDDVFNAPSDFSIDDVMTDGRVFQGGESETMLVRYSANIARWIAEREGRVLAPDGSLVIEHPLADRDWGLRHVLQYGPDAEVLLPLATRAQLRERLDSLVAAE